MGQTHFVRNLILVSALVSGCLYTAHSATLVNPRASSPASSSANQFNHLHSTNVSNSQADQSQDAANGYTADPYANNAQMNQNQQLRPSIHWGRCPQLQPTLQEKIKKAQVITKCLENTPVPDNITRETIEMHRELVAACALREEGWFEMHANASTLSEPLAAAMKAAVAEVAAAASSTDMVVSSATSSASSANDSDISSTGNNSNSGEEELDEELFGYSAIFSGGASYNYDKAEREIKSKRLQPEIEQKVLQFHTNCKSEAQHKYANPVQIIAQIQLYQACMDYFISDICQIQVQV